MIDKLAKSEDDEVVEEDATENRHRTGRNRRFEEFPAHLPMAQIQDGIKSGKFLQGTFFVSAYNCREGNVLTQMDSVDTKPGFEKGAFGTDFLGISSSDSPLKPAADSCSMSGGVQTAGIPTVMLAGNKHARSYVILRMAASPTFIFLS